jgi:transcriptional regulator with PAS, ATPase and Fis domain
LYYRLNVAKTTIPSLRERKDDIPYLAYSFLKEFAIKFNKRVKRIDPDAMNILNGYHWKGNVRELRNVIERAALLMEDDQLKEQHLDFLVESMGDKEITSDELYIKFRQRELK